MSGLLCSFLASTSATAILALSCDSIIRGGNKYHFLRAQSDSASLQLSRHS